MNMTGLLATAPWLAATPYIDTGRPDILAAVERATAGARTDIERAVRLHDLVRDIPFGWAPAFDEQTASEVLLDGRWIGTDSYNVDPALHLAAIARLRAENGQIGYGVHINGTCQWDGRSDRFSQFLDDRSVPDLSDADFVIHADIGAFYASGVGRNRPNLISRLAIRFLIIGANRRVQRLRNLA